MMKDDAIAIARRWHFYRNDAPARTVGPCVAYAAIHPRTISSVSATALACAVLFVWIAALPPFQVGLWFLTEPVEIALFAAGALAAVILLFHPRGEWAMRHPLVLIPLGLALLTAATAPFHQFPLRSAFGPPHTGEGGFWFLTMALLVALFRVADEPMVRAAALASGITLLGLWCVGIKVNSFPDYLAFVGLSIIVLREGGSRATSLDGMLVMGVALVAASGSKGAWLLVPALMALVFARVPRVALAVAAPILAMVAIDLLHAMPSAGSRIHLWGSSILALVTEPGLWQHGAGWGGMNDLVARHYRAIAQIEPTWEGLGEAWHSHNEFLEAWISVGVGGMLLMFAMFAAAVRASRGRVRSGAWCALAGLSAIWMMTPHALPFFAAALAITSTEKDSE